MTCSQCGKPLPSQPVYLCDDCIKPFPVVPLAEPTAKGRKCEPSGSGMYGSNPSPGVENGLQPLVERLRMAHAWFDIDGDETIPVNRVYGLWLFSEAADTIQRLEGDEQAWRDREKFLTGALSEAADTIQRLEAARTGLLARCDQLADHRNALQSELSALKYHGQDS
jgi:hypothetical protein